MSNDSSAPANPLGRRAMGAQMTTWNETCCLFPGQCAPCACDGTLRPLFHRALLGAQRVEMPSAAEAMGAFSSGGTIPR